MKILSPKITRKNVTIVFMRDLISCNSRTLYKSENIKFNLFVIAMKISRISKRNVSIIFERLHLLFS